MPAAAVVAELEIRPGAEGAASGSSCLTISRPCFSWANCDSAMVTQRPSFTGESPLLLFAQITY